jgi:hypothetical protein
MSVLVDMLIQVASDQGQEYKGTPQQQVGHQPSANSLALL